MTMRGWSRCAMVVGVVVAGACANPSEPAVLFDPELIAYTLPKSLNPQLSSDVRGEIRGDTVRLIIPTVVAIDSLVPVFTTTESGATVRIGSTVQQSDCHGSTSADRSR